MLGCDCGTHHPEEASRMLDWCKYSYLCALHRHDSYVYFSVAGEKGLCIRAILRLSDKGDLMSVGASGNPYIVSVIRAMLYLRTIMFVSTGAGDTTPDSSNSKHSCDRARWGNVFQ